MDPPAAAWIARLRLVDYRNHALADVAAGPGPVVVTGPNGAGKTNLLEAVSMLAPGRGLRGAALSELARAGGAGGWSVAAELGGGARIGTGSAGGERRAARVNGAAAPVARLGEWLVCTWLTPAMDRLFVEGAGSRRRFLDRLALALFPGHGRDATRYEAAMRERTRLLTGERPADPAWLASLERAMAAHGAALAAARRATVGALAPHLADVGAPFPAATLAYDDPTDDADALADLLARRRPADAAAGRATLGPHRADLRVVHAASGEPAARASTGEQKALLVGVLLAHAELVAARRGERPILLLDEVTAHFDPLRRRTLLTRLGALGQVWMTGTEPVLFEGVAGTHVDVSDGSVRAC